MSDDLKNTRAYREMSAYYYSFDATGEAAVDRLLSEVALAGKAFHNTSEWNEPMYGKPCTPIERIQAAAVESAKEVAALRARVAELEQLNSRCALCRVADRGHMSAAEEAADPLPEVTP